MDRPRRGIGAELLAVTLLVGCLAGTLAAVVSTYRRPPSRPATPPVVILAPTPPKKVEPAPKPAQVVPDPEPESRPAPPPPVDPTGRIVAELAAAKAEQDSEAEKAARRIAALESATKAAQAEADRWKRTLVLTRGQIEAREAEATRIEGEAAMAAFERDALARRRDHLKEEIERDRQRPSYAVLPHRGPNGTWRRPIVIECDGRGVTLRPAGRSFGLDEIAAGFVPGGGSFLMAVTREAVRIQRQDAPDGGEVTPYIFFIVRPDGIHSYYEARTRLERIGIAFGYELAEAEWAIDVPDLDDPRTWDGSPPSSRATPPDHRPGDVAVGPGGIDREFVWHRPGGGPNGPDDGGSPAGPGRIGGPGPAGLSGGPGRRGGGLVEGDGPGVGDGLDGGQDAWSRLGEPYDPRRPAPLASLGRGGQGLGGLGRSESRSAGGYGGSNDGSVGGSGERVGGEGRPGSGDPTGRAGHEAGGSPGGHPGGPPGADRGHGSDRAGVGGNLALGAAGNPAGQGRGDRGDGRGGEAGPTPEGTTATAGQSEGQGAAGEPGGQPGGSEGGGSSNPGQVALHAGQSGAAGGDEAGSGAGRPEINLHVGGAGAPRPIELVLACGPKGVSVHPGDYRVTKATMQSKDDLLVAQLRAIVRRREQADPEHPLEPKIRYVIEPGGHATYAAARAQVMLSGLGWPGVTQVSGGDVIRLFSTDDW